MATGRQLGLMLGNIKLRFTDNNEKYRKYEQDCCRCVRSPAPGKVQLQRFFLSFFQQSLSWLLEITVGGCSTTELQTRGLPEKTVDLQESQHLQQVGIPLPRPAAPCNIGKENSTRAETSFYVDTRPGKPAALSTFRHSRRKARFLFISETEHRTRPSTPARDHLQDKLASRGTAP